MSLQLSPKLLRHKKRSSGCRLVFSDSKTEADARGLVKSLRMLPESNRLRYMKNLKRDEREQVNAIIWGVAWLECASDIREFSKYVFTKDEHSSGERSVRKFPSPSEKPYVWDLIDTILDEQLVAVEKSRQLLVTWLACLICLWMAKFQQNRLIFVQSKKEEDAANLVYNTEWPNARISFMEDQLPLELRSDIVPAYGKLFFRDSGSRIWGIPEGGDQIRSYTASFIFSDESAFQPEFESAWKAANPSVKGGGKMLVVSSARNGAYMKRLISRV